MKERYAALKRILTEINQNFQAKWKNGDLKCPNEKITTGRVRFLVLDSSTQNSDSAEETVVCVGANYTQGTEENPSDPAVEESNPQMRSNLKRGFEDFVKNQSVWKTRNHAADSLHLETPISRDGNYHLVIANFCPFITSERGQELFESERACLLNWDHWSFKHLDQLCSELHRLRLNPVWVGHGLHSEIPCLFRQFQSRKLIARWLVMPNLSYWYNYSKWPFSQKRAASVECGVSERRSVAFHLA